MYFLKKLAADGSGNFPEIRRTQNQKNPEPFEISSQVLELQKTSVSGV
jgi:hypothetical protein